LKRNHNKVLKEFLSTLFLQKSSNAKEELDEVKKLIGTNKVMIDKINVMTYKNSAIES